MDTVVIVSLVAMGISLIIAALSLLTDRLQWGVLRYIKAEFDVRAKQWEENGTLTDQLHNYFLEVPEEGGPTNLQIISRQMGAEIASSFKLSVAGIQSGEARRFRAIENGVSQVMEDQLPQDQKIVVDIARKVSEAIGLDVAPSEIAFVLNKAGLKPGASENNGGGKGSW